MTRSVVVGIVILLLSIVHTDAYLQYVERIPNGNNVDRINALGHLASEGGGPLNDFGKAFAAAGYKWTKTLCQGDADGDGQTNGEELGDPCCTWQQGGPLPLVTDVLSDPGDFDWKLNVTDWQDRIHKCPSPTSPSPSITNASRPHDHNDEDSDPHAIIPPASPVPTPTSSSSSSTINHVVALVVAMLTLLFGG